MTAFKLTIGSSFSEHEASKGEWDALLIESGQNYVFLSEGWLRAWSATIGAGGQMIIAKVRRDEKLVAAAAFQATNGIIEFAGKRASDYSDFIIYEGLSKEETAEAIKIIMKSVRSSQSRFDHFLLGRVPAESKTLDSITKLGNGLYATICRKGVAPYMEMTAAEEKLKKKA